MGMRKLFEWLAKDVDKVLHFVVCVFIVLIATRLDMVVFHHNIWLAVMIGALVAVIAGIVKETWDFCDGEQFDMKDLLADGTGAFAGMILAVILMI